MHRPATFSLRRDANQPSAAGRRSREEPWREGRSGRVVLGDRRGRAALEGRCRIDCAGRTARGDLCWDGRAGRTAHGELPWSSRSERATPGALRRVVGVGRWCRETALGEPRWVVVFAGGAGRPRWEHSAGWSCWPGGAGRSRRESRVGWSCWPGGAGNRAGELRREGVPAMRGLAVWHLGGLRQGKRAAGEAGVLWRDSVTVVLWSCSSVRASCQRLTVSRETAALTDRKLEAAG